MMIYCYRISKLSSNVFCRAGLLSPICTHCVKLFHHLVVCEGINAISPSCRVSSLLTQDKLKLLNVFYLLFFVFLYITTFLSLFGKSVISSLFQLSLPTYLSRFLQLSQTFYTSKYLHFARICFHKVMKNSKKKIENFRVFTGQRSTNNR